MRKLMIAAALSTAAVVAGPATSQDYHGQIRALLDSQHSGSYEAGYRKDSRFGDVIELIQESSAHEFSVTLYGGVTYRVVGVCDEDCTDFDLALRDGNGNDIDSDYGDDDWPLVDVTPKYTGPFVVRMFMADCNTNSCFAGARVLRR